MRTQTFKKILILHLYIHSSKILTFTKPLKDTTHSYFYFLLPTIVDRLFCSSNIKCINLPFVLSCHKKSNKKKNGPLKLSKGS